MPNPLKSLNPRSPVLNVKNIIHNLSFYPRVKKKKKKKFSISLYALIIRHVLTVASQICISHCQSGGTRFPSETSRPPQSCLTTTNPRQWRLCAFPTFLLGFTSLRISCFLQRGWPYELVALSTPCSWSGSRTVAA